MGSEIDEACKTKIFMKEQDLLQCLFVQQKIVEIYRYACIKIEGFIYTELDWKEIELFKGKEERYRDKDQKKRDRECELNRKERKKEGERERKKEERGKESGREEGRE